MVEAIRMPQPICIRCERVDLGRCLSPIAPTWARGMGLLDLSTRGDRYPYKCISG